MRDGFVGAPRPHVRVPHIRVDDQRKRIELDCAFHLRDRFIESTQADKGGTSVPLMRGGVIRVELDCALILTFGARKIDIIPDGKILKIWRGNTWTPAEVVAEIGRVLF